MKILTTTFVFFSLITSVHYTAFAVAPALRISEIMYDPSGTDADHEWIEIENAGDVAVSISTWKFFENGSNHSLAPVAGGTSIPAHGYAIIADNAAVFQSDWPQFSGVLFDSVFSLSNTGETVSLKDATLTIVDSATYVGVSGAGGDGSSLFSLSSSPTIWLPGAPTPGLINQTENPDASDPDTQTEENQTTGSSSQEIAAQNTLISSGQPTTAVKEKVKVEKKVSAHIVAPSGTILAGASTIFSAKVLGVDGSQTFSGSLFWNFGDGQSLTVKNSNQPTTHTYDYPGRYVVQLLYYENYYEIVPKASDRMTATVVENQVTFTGGDTALSVKNNGKSEIDISDWVIREMASRFTFPKQTTLLAGSTITIAKVAASLPITGEYTLTFPNSQLIATTKNPEVDLEISPQVATTKVHMPIAQKVSVAPTPATATMTPLVLNSLLNSPIITTSPVLTSIVTTPTITTSPTSTRPVQTKTLQTKTLPFTRRQMAMLLGTIIVSSLLALKLAR